MRVSANGGTPERSCASTTAKKRMALEILPGGETVLFTLATAPPPSGGTRRRLWHSHWDRASERSVDGGSDARYVPTGHLVYVLGRIVFAVPMDLRRLEVTGGPFRLSKVSGDRP